MTLGKPTANELVDESFASHTVKDEPLNTSTTDGIQRTLAAHGAAIKALADHIDGKVEPKAEQPKVAARR